MLGQSNKEGVCKVSVAQMGLNTMAQGVVKGQSETFHEKPTTITLVANSTDSSSSSWIQVELLLGKRARGRKTASNGGKRN